jgi:hypothetical protein
MKRCYIPIATAWIAVLVAVTVLLAADNKPIGEPKAPAESDRLVIHEWGTFTCVQDETGRPVAGVNTDDEPVPAFVHRISDLIPRPSQLAPVYSKGVPRSHREVRMRLETPVVYFYPPKGLRQPLQATVQIGFQGGWLTEYYPTAQVSAPGLQQGNFRFAGLTPKTVGTLEWNDLTIYPIDAAGAGQGGTLPETNAAVWLAPREVRAARIKAPGGEAEKYLFYRGVGNLPSPITVTRTLNNDGLIVREDVPAHLGLRGPLSIRAMWLVHVREDGSVAFRSLGGAPLTGESGHELAQTPVDFAETSKPQDKKAPAAPAAQRRTETLIDNYSPKNLAALRVEMRKELIADGLYDDEADAMLKTWELAYFKSSGLRLFYLLPQQWTDAVLPLHCSLLAEVSRTMVGRIELVTPRQRTLLKDIETGKISRIDWIHEKLAGRPDGNELFTELSEGETRFQDLAIPLPPDYQAYVDLGRFRNALILDELSRNPASGIGRFAEAYQLEYYTPEEPLPETKTARNR